MVDPAHGGSSESSELKHKAAVGAAMTMAGQLGRAVINFAGLMLLARLLTPQDYGLVAMVLAIVGIGEVIRDFGLMTAAMQAKTLSVGQRDNLFWINTGIGSLLAVLVFALAVPIAAIYGEPALVGITHAIAVTFLLSGLATQYRASLGRELRFAAIALADLGSLAVGLCVAVGLALFGSGFWALVIQQIVQSAAVFIILVAAGRWRPGLPSRTGDMTALLRFGLHQMLIQLISYAGRNVDSIVIGARFGPIPLGFYNRAFNLYSLPTNQVSVPAGTVAVPVLARLQDDPPLFADYLVRGQVAIVHIVGAVSAVLIFQARPLVTLFLGPDWTDTAPLLAVLAVGGTFAAASSATYWVLTPTGRSAGLLRMTVVTRPLMVVVIVIGSSWGTMGVAAGYTASVILTWVIGLLWVVPIIGSTTLRLVKNVGVVVIGYGFAGVISALAGSLVAQRDLWWQLIIGTASFAGVICALALAWPTFRNDLLSVVRLRRLLRVRPGLT